MTFPPSPLHCVEPVPYSRVLPCQPPSSISNLHLRILPPSFPLVAYLRHGKDPCSFLNRR